MLNERKVKKIDGIEHKGKIPKPCGRWLWLVDRCPLWLSIIILFFIIIIEIFVFACLYGIISSTSIKESFDYSLFSVLGGTVAASVRNSLIINRIICGQSILTNSIISFYVAVVLYKLINVKPLLIKMEDHVVFDPTSGTLRLRIANTSRFHITNVRITMNSRIHIPNGGRYANTDLKLKRSVINVLRPYSVWNIATKPFLPKNDEEARLDIERYDNTRMYEFIPDLLQKRYRSDDPEKAKNLDFKNLDVIITIRSPLFGSDWVYQKSFSVKDFVCGRIISLDPHIPGKSTFDWSNWERYNDMSESHCADCVFAKYCGINKKHLK